MLPQSRLRSFSGTLLRASLLRPRHTGLAVPQHVLPLSLLLTGQRQPVHQLGKGFRSPSPPSLHSTPSEDAITTHIISEHLFPVSQTHLFDPLLLEFVWSLMEVPAIAQHTVGTQRMVDGWMDGWMDRHMNYPLHIHPSQIFLNNFQTFLQHPLYPPSTIAAHLLYLILLSLNIPHRSSCISLQTLPTLTHPTFMFIPL